jgi:hypothetical protein
MLRDEFVEWRVDEEMLSKGIIYTPRRTKEVSVDDAIKTSGVGGKNGDFPKFWCQRLANVVDAERIGY